MAKHDYDADKQMTEKRIQQEKGIFIISILCSICNKGADYCLTGKNSTKNLIAHAE